MTDISSYRAATLGLVRNGDDLTARQTAILLSLVLDDDSKRICDLATELNVSPPIVTVAVDRLVSYGFVKRRENPADTRSILVAHTLVGRNYVRRITALLDGTAKPAAKVKHQAKAAEQAAA